MDQTSDPILTLFRAALAKAYRERVEPGSCCSVRGREATRARIPTTTSPCFSGISQASSREMGPIAEIETDILMDTGAVINALPLRAGAYRERTGLMGELRREGYDL